MDNSLSGDAVTITISGNISIIEVSDILKQHFSNRNVLLNGDAKSDNFADFDSGDIIIRSSPYQMNGNPAHEELLGLKNKKILELEKTTEKALDSVQTFQRQHQALYDRFVSLRQMFDEQKLSLLNTLWIHCGAYHPELREIPVVENMARFIENDDRVGEFQVGETLGQGQFATVRACTRDGTRNELAVKIIKKDRFTTFTALKRISNEIEILRKLKSEFIVSVKDVVQTMDNLYIVTEKGGRDLFESFDDSPDGVPESWAREIITCVLKAVLYCHDRDICHRDLKPENILLTFDKEGGKCVDLKLCDFGLSTRFSSSSLLTDFCGSPGFFAPEMIITGTYEGDKADVWSTGCILLELLFGHMRFIDVWMNAYDYEVLQNKDEFTKQIKITVEDLPSNLAFSPQLNDFIMQLLILNPKHRPKTRVICAHPWLEGAFDSLLVPKTSGVKVKAKRRPSISDVLGQSQSDSSLIPMHTKVKSMNNEAFMKERQETWEVPAADSGCMTSDDPNIPQGMRPSPVTLPKLQKDKSQSSNLEIKGGESPRILMINRKIMMSSPSSSAKSIMSGIHGEDCVSEKSYESLFHQKGNGKLIMKSFDSVSSEQMGDSIAATRRGSEIDLGIRAGALPPIVDGVSTRSHDMSNPTIYPHDEEDMADSDSFSVNAQGLVNAAIYSLSRGASRRLDVPGSQSPQLQSPMEPECNSGGSSAGSGSGSGVSFFGYGNRQYSAPRGSFANEFTAPRGSFANDFSAPRGSFANDVDTNPRGSFVSDCGTNPRSSFFNDTKSTKDLVTRTSCMPSMASSVTVTPVGASPVATPTAGSATPTLRNIDEESDEMTSIDELRNFLSSGGFSFLGSK